MSISKPTRIAIGLLGDQLAARAARSLYDREGGLKLAEALHDMLICALVDFENKRRDDAELRRDRDHVDREGT